MKLFFLFILLCGITPTSPVPSATKKVVAGNENTEKNFDMIPCGLFFQF